jgi:hypothetical protein
MLYNHKYQFDSIDLVYNKILQYEKAQWGPHDDQLACLDWLTNDELYRESELLFERQRKLNPRCLLDHPISECMIPTLFIAVSTILSLYRDTNELLDKYRYILKYYLLMNQCGFIVTKS